MPKAISLGRLFQTKQGALKALPVIAKMKPKELNKNYNGLGDQYLSGAVFVGVPLKVIRAMVEQGADVDAKNDDGETAYAHALKEGRPDVAKYLLSVGAKKGRFKAAEDMTPKQKAKALHKAIEDYEGGVAKKLLKGGADPNAMIGGRSLWLWHTADSGDSAVTRAMLAAGATVTSTDKGGNTALHLLCAHCQVSKDIPRIVDAGCEVNARNKKGETALHVAARSGYWESTYFIKALLKAGVDPLLKDKKGKTAHDVAEDDAKELLFEFTSPRGSGDKLAKHLMKAVLDNKLTEVQKLCKKGANPSAILTQVLNYHAHYDSEWKGLSPLHAAMRRDVKRKIAEYLLDQEGVDVNVKDATGRTPMHDCLQYKPGAERRALALRMVELGAKLNQKNDSGNPAFFELVGAYQYSGEIELLEELVEHGANLKIKNKSKRNLLENCMDWTSDFHEVHDKKGWLRMARHLLELGVKVNPKTFPFRGSTFEQWLAEKESKHLLGKRKKVAKKSAARTRVERAYAPLLGREDSDNYFVLLGDKTPVAPFSWFALKDELENDEGNEYEQICEYHIPTGEVSKKVDRGAWVPFAVVGMTGALDFYEETSAGGTLFFDLRKKSGTMPVVFWCSEEGDSYEEGQAIVLASSLSKLLADSGAKVVKKAAKKAVTKKAVTKKAVTKKAVTKKTAGKPAKKSAGASKRGKVRLEYRSGASNKFWEIVVAGKKHTVRYGRISSDGQSKEKSFTSPAQAKTEASKLIAQKKKKGYSAV